MRVFRSPGWFGVRIGRIYLSARGPEHRPYFSERNRIRCRVLDLPRGWRLVVMNHPIPGRKAERHE